MYSAQLKRQNRSDGQIAVYYHPCNQNTNNYFGPLKQEDIRKLTFVIVSKLFLANRPIPSCLLFKSPLCKFSFIFRFKVCSAAGKIIKKLEIVPTIVGYILKGEKVMNDRMKLEIK